ncbi:MAG: hypothetical protein IJC16_08330 [Rikenellaceae bacterium]|nr:hypothetical protein [Rikenellaceae bacterium]
MKYLHPTYARIWVRLLAALPVLLLVSGCVNDYDECPAPERGSEPVKLRFTIVTRTSASSAARQTRAADIAGDQTGIAAENYLNLAGHDIRFLLFDSDRKLLRDFTPDANLSLAAGDGGNYIVYTVKASIVEPYFANVATADTDFYIMVIANGRPHRMTALGLTPGTTTIEDVSGQLITFVQKTYIIVDPETGMRGGWTPSQPGMADGEYIPMAGLQHFTLLQGAFDGNGPEGFVELSPENGSKNINMLRALAKIEVIDKIGITGNFADAPEKRVNVEKAELFGRCATGTVLPDYAQWNRNGVLETQQVDAPTMASPMQYFPPTDDAGYPNWSSLIEFYEDIDARAARADGCPVFSAYVTEYSRAAISDRLPPYIRVTINDPDKPDSEQSKFYRIELASYNDKGKPDNQLSALLRNHIYRYEITYVNSQSSKARSALSPSGGGMPGSLGITMEKKVWGD